METRLWAWPHTLDDIARGTTDGGPSIYDTQEGNSMIEVRILTVAELEALKREYFEAGRAGRRGQVSGHLTLDHETFEDYEQTKK